MRFFFSMTLILSILLSYFFQTCRFFLVLPYSRAGIVGIRKPRCLDKTRIYIISVVFFFIIQRIVFIFFPFISLKLEVSSSAAENLNILLPCDPPLQGKLPLASMTVTKLDDSDAHKNAFELNGRTTRKC